MSNVPSPAPAGPDQRELARSYRTELHAVEEAVRAGEQRLRIAAENTHDYAIITADEEGLITTWNVGAQRIFGWSEDEVRRQSASIIFTAEDRALGADVAEMRKARENGRAEDERWHVRKDGSSVYMSGVLMWVGDAAEKGYAKIARDMTDARQADIAREGLLERERAINLHATQANLLKDEFLAVMSHELKNPLNLIQVNAEMLMRMPAVQRLPEVMLAGQNIVGAVRSQSKIIDDLLDLSRARTGKLALQLVTVPLNDLVVRIVDAARDAATAKGLTLVVDEGSEKLAVRGDPTRTEQIVWNLLSNAIRFTGRGGRVLLSVDRDGPCAKLSVADTGSGIAPEYLSQVFDMFSQGGQQIPGSGGLGIGLTLVQQLATAQGGHVSVASPGLGHGSTFCVWLPLADSDGEGGRAAQRAPALTGLRVLAVDDWGDMLQMFAALLRTEGCTVETAMDGPSALGRLRLGGFDLLVTDIGMPGMDGYELVREARGLPAGASLIAIAATGFGRAGDVRKAMEAGFDAHLPKPVSIDSLVAVVTDVRGRRLN